MERFKGVIVKEKKRMVMIVTKNGEKHVGEVIEELLELTNPQGEKTLIPYSEFNLKNVSYAISINPDSDTQDN